MSINLYKKKTINNQPVLEELLSKSTDTVDNKPLVYDSTTDNVKSVDDLNVNSVTASCFHGPLDGTAKNATCFDNKTYAEACADILSGCAADSNKLNGKIYSEVCSDILSGTAANSTCFAGKTCTEWKDIIKTTCVDNAALATNATCFNGCTYAEACTDIRNGLATQVCADAIQDCADYIQSCVSAIESKIPAQASDSNQLADKDFVNSSITTNTANFRGTYACVADLPSTGNTNNDYAFVCSLNTTTGNYIYDRYKWVASDSCWVCEYELNTTGFTAEQLASINSGITSNLVAKITDVYDNTVTICMNDECKGSFSLNQNTDICIDLGNTIRNANCAGYATSAAQASEATNATKFNNKTYNEAYADIRTGTVRAIKVGTSSAVTPDGSGTACLPAYPPDLSSCDGLDCVGTVTQVKVGETAYDPVSGVVSLPEYPTIPTTVCTAECANTVKRNTANSGSCYLALFDGNTAVSNANLYVSNAKQISFCPATGCLSTCYVRGISGLIAGNPIGCTSSVLGQSGTNISSGLLNLYTASPSIGFHVNHSAATSQSITADCGRLRVCVNDRTGCDDFNETANFDFCSDGTFTGACTICASTNIYSAGCPVVTTGTLPTVAPGYNCTGTSNYVVTTMVCCAKQVCRNQATTGTCHLALFSDKTAVANADAYVSNACPITYAPATGILTTGILTATTVCDCLGVLQTSKTQVTATDIGLTACECYPLQTVIDCLLHCYGAKPALYSFAFANASNLFICEGSMYAYNYRIEKLDSNDPVNVKWQKTQWKVEACTGRSWTVSAYVGAKADSITWAVTENIPTASRIDTSSCNAEYPLVFSTCCATPAVGNRTLYNDSANNLMYNPATGLLCSAYILAEDLCSTNNVCTDGLYACGEVHLGSQCDIYIYDGCGNDFICGWNNNLTVGYSSSDFVNNDNECCRITVGLNNHMCAGTNCGDSVVVGYNNWVCWSGSSNLSFIYGYNNTTKDGGLAVGGWNITCGECSIVLGFDSFAQECSISIGVSAYANCPMSIAIGCDSDVCGYNSIAIGYESCTLYGNNSIAIGCHAITEQPNSIAIGWESCANGVNSVAIGPGSEAEEASIAIGNNAYSNDGSRSIAIGCEAKACRCGSIAIGSGAISDNYNSIAIGEGAYFPYPLDFDGNAHGIVHRMGNHFYADVSIKNAKDCDVYKFISDLYTCNSRVCASSWNSKSIGTYILSIYRDSSPYELIETLICGEVKVNSTGSVIALGNTANFSCTSTSCLWLGCEFVVHFEG